MDGAHEIMGLGRVTLARESVAERISAMAADSCSK